MKKGIILIAAIWVFIGSLMVFYGINYILYESSKIHVFQMAFPNQIKTVVFGLIYIGIGFFLFVRPKMIVPELYSIILLFFSYSIIWNLLSSIQNSSIEFQYFIISDYLLVGFAIFSVNALKKEDYIAKSQTFKSVIADNSQRILFEIIGVNIIICSLVYCFGESGYY